MTFKEYLVNLREAYYCVSIRFVKSRSCMIWLFLTIISTCFFALGTTDFIGWSAFVGSSLMLALGANKTEQIIKKNNESGK